MKLSQLHSPIKQLFANKQQMKFPLSFVSKMTIEYQFVGNQSSFWENHDLIVPYLPCEINEINLILSDLEIFIEDKDSNGNSAS